MTVLIPILTLELELYLSAEGYFIVLILFYLVLRAGNPLRINRLQGHKGSKSINKGRKGINKGNESIIQRE